MTRSCSSKCEHVSFFPLLLQDESPEWQDWMLPVQQDGNLLHMAFYAADVASFAESFMKKTGLMKMGQKQLPMSAAGQSQPVEQRTG